MKKRQVNLKRLSLKKSSVASLEANGVTGGFQSWTGTAEPCFTDFDCNPTVGCPQETDGCPVYTDGCPVYTNGCPPPTLLCNSHSVCPPGVYCY